MLVVAFPQLTHSMISKIHCPRECTSESLSGMLFIIVYFSILFSFRVLYDLLCRTCAW